MGYRLNVFLYNWEEWIIHKNTHLAAPVIVSPPKNGWPDKIGSFHAFWRSCQCSAPSNYTDITYHAFQAIWCSPNRPPKPQNQPLRQNSLSRLRVETHHYHSISPTQPSSSTFLTTRLIRNTIINITTLHSPLRITRLHNKNTIFFLLINSATTIKIIAQASFFCFTAAPHWNHTRSSSVQYSRISISRCDVL